MSEDYNPHSVNAVLSRVETKLDRALEEQAAQARSIGKLWAALGRLDVRVAVISGGISVAVVAVKLIFFNN